MCPKISTPTMRNQAYHLRRNQTEAEKYLWGHLRAHRLQDVHFRRQYAIGEFIVDFCAPRKKIVIEIDGQPHSKSRERDDERSRFLISRGYTVLRFWNHEVMSDVANVLAMIDKAVKDK